MLQSYAVCVARCDGIDFDPSSEGRYPTDAIGELLHRKHGVLHFLSEEIAARILALMVRFRRKKMGRTRRPAIPHR
jgi:hypothetical protein